jgi:hypothetical protein
LTGLGSRKTDLKIHDSLMIFSIQFQPEADPPPAENPVNSVKKFFDAHLNISNNSIQQGGLPCDTQQDRHFADWQF